MVMLVLASAVTLSPIVMVMGLRSLASIVFGLSEIFTTGLEGAFQEKEQNVSREEKINTFSKEKILAMVTHPVLSDVNCY